MANSNPIIAGTRFGRLLVKEEIFGRRLRHYLCECDCGTEKIVRRDHLLETRVRSCGCLLRESAARSHWRHGESSRQNRTVEYATWVKIKCRCQNPSDISYENYGGRGIRICDRWSDSFESFLADMGRRPKNTSIDRIDNNGHYEPGNCRWASIKIQSRNKRTNVMVSHNGQTKTVAEWAEAIGIGYFTLHSKIKRGMTPEQALTNKRISTWARRPYYLPPGKKRKSRVT